MREKMRELCSVFARCTGFYPSRTTAEGDLSISPKATGGINPMKFARISKYALTVPALALVLAASTPLFAQYGPQGPPPGDRYAQGPGGWDAPPQEFREIQRQGFHDGIEGARHDFDNHRRPDVNNRDEYRHPHVPPSARRDYREGFRRGYDVAMSHLMGGPR
jgi:hypothetical protein